MKEKDITRVTVNLNTSLVNEVDEYAEKMNINRTSAVAVLLSQAVNAQNAMNDLSKLVKLAEEEQKNTKKK